MKDFASRVALLTGAAEADLRPLASESLSQVLLVPRHGGTPAVAKSGPAVATEAAMLRTLAGAGIPVPAVEAEHGDILLLEHVENDRVFSARAWADVGAQLARLHRTTGDGYGWPVDYALGSVKLDNREGTDWPHFWAEQRLVATASVLDRPWRERIDRLARRLPDLLPASPAAALLHGDLWSGNILVREGRLAALIDPACYYGHAEVDLAMLDLFGPAGETFQPAYGELEPGWRERRRVYQLFPALAHARLWGQSYFAMVDRLLSSLGA